MVNLSESQRQALETHGGQPVPVLDERTQKVYYLISAAQFEQVQTLFTDEPFTPSELYSLTAKTAAEAGWSDPRMDEYDRYDEHHPQR